MLLRDYSLHFAQELFFGGVERGIHILGMLGIKPWSAICIVWAPWANSLATLSLTLSLVKCQ